MVKVFLVLLPAEEAQVTNLKVAPEVTQIVLCLREIALFLQYEMPRIIRCNVFGMLQNEFDCLRPERFDCILKFVDTNGEAIRFVV